MKVVDETAHQHDEIACLAPYEIRSVLALDIANLQFIWDAASDYLTGLPVG